MSPLISTKKLSVLLLGVALLLLGLASQAQAAAPAWTLHMAHSPGTFERIPDQSDPEYTVVYTVATENSGDETTTGAYTLTDTPPPQLSVKSISAGAGWSCTPSAQVIAGTPLSCTSEASLAPGASAPVVSIVMNMAASAPDTLTNEAAISGGGGSGSSASDPALVIERLPFSINEFSVASLDEAGHDYTVAGGHPYEDAASFMFPTYSTASEGSAPVQDLKDAFTELPPGVIGNASAMPRCSLTALAGFIAVCPPASKIGELGLYTRGALASTNAIYNMVPEYGYSAEFAFKVANNSVVLYAQLRPRTGHYGVNVVVPGASRIYISGTSLKFFGIPSLHNGVGGPEIPFLSNPVDCQEAQPATRIAVDTWENPGRQIPGLNFGAPDLSDPLWKTAVSPAPAVTGCDTPALAAQFKPSIDVQPVQATSTVQADQPSGLKVALDFPQSNDPTDLNTVFDPSLPQAPELKDATVTLPAGVSISPSAAAGLDACSDQASDPAGDQVHYDNTNPVACPDTSKIGTVTATSPLLASHDPVSDAVNGAEPLHGDVYLLKTHPGDLPVGGDQDGTYRMLIQIESARYGVNVKVPGTVVADKSTGQLTATFTENPQLPVKHLELDFTSGPRAPLATPVTCGAFTTSTDMVPWSTPGTSDATPSSGFQVEAGPNGAACASTPAQRPFAPTVSAGTESAVAGASSPFVVALTRNDGEQELGALNLSLPQGFTAKLTGIPYCPEPAIAAAAGKTGAEEQASPSCPVASQVGTLTVGAGPGTNPYHVDGKAYLAGPYKGAPLSVVFVTPALAGPFDLGTVVVRAAVFIDPHTARVTVKTDPIPQIIDGVPLRLRSIVAHIDRPGFALNPTNCTPLTLSGEAFGSSGATAALSSHFQVGGCANLPFKPGFKVSTSAKTSRANGASLTVKLSQKPGEANIHRAKVELPKILPSRLSTLQKACTAAQFEANPAGCPAESVVGHARATTPVLPVPIEGPAYFVSHGGEAFPSLIMVLQGYGIKIDLVGTTFIDHTTGVTSTTFAAAPDVPVSTFELTLPTGKYSALAANGNLCTKSLAMPTEFTGQNGAEVKRQTPIEVEGCSTALAVSSHKVLKKTLTLSIYVPAAGQVSVSGKGLKSTSKKVKGREQVTIKLTQRRAGKLKTKVRVLFTPSTGKQRKKQSKSLTVQFRR